MFSRVTATAAMLVMTANADIYMHNPRGSNNRLDEARRDRNNANRVFDSQNNNRGGSNVGSLYYFNEEKVTMEWTNQHGCGQSINDCQLVMQYMCDDRVRDGVTTRTIPQTPTQCLNNDCNTDVRYGMHESYDYYMNCRYRFRNRGLFNADRNLNGNTARFTRQNNNGNRRGYECPEERDNYPYWHPTPWVDLAVYTTAEDDTDFANRCSIYQTQSENVKGRHFCSIPDSWYHNMIRNGGNGNNGFIPNTELLCVGEDGTGGLNAENSQMMQFIAQNDAAATASIEAKINAEFAACNTFMTDIQELCTTANGTQVQTCTQYNAFFNKDSEPVANRQYLLEGDFATPCPVCANTTVPHPASSCTMCGPSTCTAALAFSEYLSNTTTCKEGSVPDVDSEWCITNACVGQFNRLSIEEINANEKCRSDLTGAKFLVEPTNGDSTIKSCAVRVIASKSCRLQGNRAEWKQADAHNVAIPTATAPVCRSATWSRENHLGNGMGGQTNAHNFTIPSHIHESCAMRIRYNISTKDYYVDGKWVNAHYSMNLTNNELSSTTMDSTYNKRGGNNPAKVQLNSAANVPTVSSGAAYENARGFLWKNNPKVSIFDFDELVMYCYKQVGATLRRNTAVNTAPVDQIREGDRTMCYPLNGTTDYAYAAASAFCPTDTTSSAMEGVVYGEADGNPQNQVTTAGADCADAIKCPDAAGTPARACTTRAMNNGGVRRQNGNTNGNDNSDDKDFRLQLAINTNQFGRTFQDRTFSYEVREQTAKEAECDSIYALNVRGKRGNVVQTFPGTEYDFVPNRLNVRENDCIHFQWTGSNTNPNNNDGQGKQGTDRHNIVLLEKNRGEGSGGRGVSRYGGAGQDGATWTTLNMDPGFENFQGAKMQMAPDMFDFPCDTQENRVTGNVFAIPFGGWKYCSNMNPNTPATKDAWSAINDDSTCTGPYTQCATEGGNCECVGTVQYGANGKFAYEQSTGSIACTNGVFGDPVQGTRKTCSCRSASIGYTAYTPTGATEALVCVKDTQATAITSVARKLTTTWSGMAEVNQDPASMALNLEAAAVGIMEKEKFGSLGNSHPEHLDNSTRWRVFGATYEYLEALATLSNGQFRGEMSELDDAGTYADFGVQLITGAIGRMAYLCTRNNNFSNRSQKGTIIVSYSTEKSMSCGMESCTIVADGSGLKVPAGQSVGQVTLSNKAASEENGATSQTASDVVLVNGNLNLEAKADWVQTSAQAPVGPGRRQAMTNASGLWLQATVPEPLNVDGDNYTISIHLKSPNSSVLWKTSAALDEQHQYMCVKLTWDDYVEETHFLLSTWNDLKYSWTIPFNLRESLSNAYKADNVWLDVQFPQNGDGLYNCSGMAYNVQQTVKESKDPFEITIPTLAVWKIGQVEHFTGKQAQMCFDDGNAEACAALKAEAVEADCDGEACMVKCTKNCAGYYRVQAEDTVPMIIGITLAVLVVAGATIGAAFYFRKSPEKWDSVKLWGPNKYKSIKLSMQDKI